MKQFTLFDGQVDLVVTEKPDGNMKLSPCLDYDEQALARQNRLKAVKSIGLDAQNTVLVRVSYDQRDYCKFVSLESAAGLSFDDVVAENSQDGILTCTPGLGIFLPLADCLGLVLFDPETRTLMVAHCGRHTLLQNGAHKAVMFMSEQATITPERLLVWFSPCAGKENYPVFDAGNRGLQELATKQLEEAGVLAHNWELSSIDTTRSPDYFSHSQGDTRERFALCAKIATPN